MNPRRGPRRSVSPSPRQFGGPRRVLALPFLRSRVHPLLLIPVFLLGAYFSPFHSASTPTYAGELYRGEDAYDWSKDSFLPPDAPPLNAYDEDYGIRKVDGGDGKLAKSVRERGNGREVLDDDRDLLGWGSSSSSDSPSYFAELDGYLYYPASAPLVHVNIPKSSKKAPPPPVFRAPPQNAHGDSQLPPWSIPGAQFKKKVVSLEPPSPLLLPIANAPPPLVPLQRPLQPPRLPVNPAPLQRPIAAPARRPAAPPVIERGADGRRLGPNAAAMIRAEREGRPFIPGKPADMVLEENLKIAAAKVRARKQELEALAAGGKKAPVVLEPGRGRGVAALGGRGAALPAAALPGRGAGAPAAAFLGKGREVAVEKEVERAAPAPIKKAVVEGVDDDDDEEEEGEDDDLLQEIRGLTEEERSYLSPEELALIDDIETEFAAPRKLEAAVVPPKVVDKMPQGRGVRGAQFEKNKPLAAQPRGRGVQGQAQGRDRIRKRALDFADSESEPLDSPPDSLPLADSSDPPSSSDSLFEPPLPVDAEGSKSTLARRAAADSTPLRSTGGRIHPISYLIKSAEKKWDVMLRQQSQTLEQAVIEYKRRYGRNPPLGFDQWCVFCFFFCQARR